MTTEQQFLEFCNDGDMYQTIQNLLVHYGKFASLSDHDLEHMPQIKKDIAAFKSACAIFSAACGLPQSHIFITIRTLYIALLQNHMMSDEYNATVRRLDD